MSKIYRNSTFPALDIPSLDLLTFLFESEHSLAEDEEILHLSADDASRCLTKSQLNDLTQRVAHCLRNEYGVGSGGQNGDVVTVMSYGQPILPAAYFGVIAAGGVFSGAGRSLTVGELVQQVRLTSSQVIICSSEVIDTVRETAKLCGMSPQNVLRLESSPTWTLARSTDDTDLLTEDRLHWQTCTNERELEESLVTIVWSSGTTGVPKGVYEKTLLIHQAAVRELTTAGVKLSHRNLVSQAFITHFQGRVAAHKRIEQGTYEAYKFRTIAHLPANHISGLFGYFISAMCGGGTVVWMRNYQWHQFLRYCKQYQITYLFTVPSIYLRIAKSPDVTDEFSHLKAAATGSSSMDGKLQTVASNRLGIAKNSLISPSWGLSETTGAVTMTPDYLNDEVGSLGPILPCLEVRIVNDDFLDVDDGQPGELVVCGPTVTKGYHNNAQATRNAFRDGWFQTGDIAVRCTNGQFFMVDRKKELLKYKGLQVSPAELEHLLNTHPAIKESAVIGIPSTQDPSSDWPRAYVVADPSEISAEEVKDFVKSRMAAYKQLRGGVVFVQEISKNPGGKILRRELRNRAKVETAQESKARL